MDGEPEHVDDAARDIEQVGVAVVQQLAGDAVGLLVDHLRDTSQKLGFIEDVVSAEVGLDLLVVGVLGEVVGLERGCAQVLDRLCLRQDPALELVGDPETRARLVERLRVVGSDRFELDTVVCELQHGRLGSRRSRNQSSVRLAELGATRGHIGRQIAPSRSVVDDALEMSERNALLRQKTEELGAGIKLGANRFEGCDGVHRVPLSLCALLAFS